MKNSLSTNLILAFLIWIGPIAFSRTLTPFYERQLHVIVVVGLLLTTFVSVIVTVISIMVAWSDPRTIEFPLVATFIVTILGFSALFAPPQYHLDGIVRSWDWLISSLGISLLWFLVTHVVINALLKDTNK